jgi:hypothetical protein
LRVINPDTFNRKNGHRLVLVEDVKTGERKEVRADNLISGNTQSCGRIKKERYKEKLAKMIPETDIDGITAVQIKPKADTLLLKTKV